MIKSMTGFASLTHEDERATIGLTVRTVNHRFLDIQLRIPSSLADLEEMCTAIVFGAARLHNNHRRCQRIPADGPFKVTRVSSA